MKTRLSLWLTVSLLLASLAVGLSQAQGPQPQMALSTPFTYQGQLRQNGSLVNGTCDFQFSLWSAATGGSQAGSILTKTGIAVSRGLFTVLLDFGTSPFQGEDRYLQVAVRCPSGSGGYTTLNGRQALTAAPYALYALSGPFWSLTGNAGTNQAVNYVGTADNVALNFRVNGTRALRLEPNSIGPNVIGGFVGNNVTAGAAASTIAGGGSGGNVNRVTDSYGTVGGGNNNQAGNSNVNIGDANYATVAGGLGNTAGSKYTTVAGGSGNSASGDYAAVGGGLTNAATGNYATVGGGISNETSGASATVSGGNSSAASGEFATVAGGLSNTASAERAAIGGGSTNTASEFAATVGGGTNNTASGQYTAMGGGEGNTASGTAATVPGGYHNAAGGSYSLAAGMRAQANHAGAFVWADATSADFASTANNQFAVRASGGVVFTSTLGAMLRLEPNSHSPIIIGGHSENSATSEGATISGGGAPGGGNSVTNNYGTVGGGYSNAVSGDSATIGGGKGNSAGGGGSVVGGGGGNTASEEGATVGGGMGNWATGLRSTVAGGNANSANAAYSTIGGGTGNEASGLHSTVAGGNGSAAGAPFSTVGGGYENQATGERSTVAGGRGNIASAYSATVGGGQGNDASATRATIAGGQDNTAEGTYNSIGGGQNNATRGSYATIGGGNTNAISISGISATIGGGQNNEANNMYATVGGGYYNTASGNRATVPGGAQNTAQGDYSFAAGRRAQANNPGCFVWGDSTDADVLCSNNNRFIARASGGVYLYSNSTLTTGVYLAAGASTWTPISAVPSDRNLKENFTPVDGRDVLQRLANIPISAWNYKADGEAILHMGPMAQDFYAAFGLGENDVTIGTVDADGVALAALQGAYQLLEEKDVQIAAQQEQIDDLESRVAALEALVAQLAQK